LGLPIISQPHKFHVDDLYVDLRQIFGYQLYLKCEGFNFAGSIKLKSAVEMIEAAERSGVVGPGVTLVESSSGNLGVALSLVAASKGYRFLCVTDPRCTDTSRRLMETLGGSVCVVTDGSGDGGYLGARLRYVRDLCRGGEYVWLNQYGNPSNAAAHYRTTGPEIAKMFPALDVLFIGAGTTGTLMGCSQYFREFRPEVTIVAIDSVGSVTFGGPPGTRMIPGLGAGVRPGLLDESYVDAVVHVPEGETVRACRRLARHGFVFGGSTGTVISGAMAWLADNRPGQELTAVAIAPDLGERYVDTIYSDQWLQAAYGAVVRDADDRLGAS
jgi:N-(2-amino-2-carboxyethyl)-L-glutamate synthase